jgi:polysaccharide pyruvyl transferase WcaK-like protein
MNHKTCYIVDGQLSSVGDAAIRAACNIQLIKRNIIPITFQKSALKSIDYIIWGGGGILYERGNRIQKIETNIFQHMNSEAELHIVGAGSQEFQCDPTQVEQIKAQWRQRLLSAKYISMRDHGSLDEMERELSFSKDDLSHVEVHGDLAFGLYRKDLNYPNDSIDNKNILISVRTEEDPQVIASTIQFLQTLVKRGYNLIWYPHDFKDYINYRDIWIPNIGGTLVGALQCEDRAIVLDYNLYINLARQCRASITRRLHGLILGMIAGRPVLSLGGGVRKNQYQIKYLFGDKSYPYILQNEFDSSSALDLFEQMLKDKTIYDQFNSISSRELLEIEQHYKMLGDK